MLVSRASVSKKQMVGVDSELPNIIIFLTGVHRLSTLSIDIIIPVTYQYYDFIRMLLSYSC